MKMLWLAFTQPTKLALKRCSRRSEEADSRQSTNPPPYVGGYLSRLDDETHRLESVVAFHNDRAVGVSPSVG
jgi:hypothetical protein